MLVDQARANSGATRRDREKMGSVSTLKGSFGSILCAVWMVATVRTKREVQSGGMQIFNAEFFVVPVSAVC